MSVLGIIATFDHGCMLTFRIWWKLMTKQEFSSFLTIMSLPSLCYKIWHCSCNMLRTRYYTTTGLALFTVCNAYTGIGGTSLLHLATKHHQHKEATRRDEVPSHSVFYYMEYRPRHTSTCDNIFIEERNTNCIALPVLSQCFPLSVFVVSHRLGQLLCSLPVRMVTLMW